MNYEKILKSVGDVTLLAVTKGRTVEEIQTLYDLGCRDFGENRIVEALPKIELLPKDIRWHFIGSLQKNKVRKAVEHFSLIHGVDSLELAVKVSECAVQQGKVVSILLQVNTSGEASKHGFSESQISQSFAQLARLAGIKIEGLMTMASLTDDTEVIRDCFARLRALRERLDLKELSMGMSHDYTIAIEEGATIVRIGSALFDF